MTPFHSEKVLAVESCAWEKYQPHLRFLHFSTFFLGAYLTDYFWRDFSGPIPSDAVEGGNSDVNGSTFIGQALDLDLSPVEIHEGRNEVYIPVEFPKPQTSLIKVS